MARFAILSAAYLGDIAPFIPVGRRLAAAGHDVTFVAPEGFRPVLESEPFRFHAYGLDMSSSAMHGDPEHERLMRHAFRNTVKLGKYWQRKSVGDDPDAVMASLDAGFAGADVVIAHPTMCPLAIPVARSIGAKVATGHLFPMMIPTAERTPPIGARSLRLPAPVNRAAWWVLRRTSGRSFGDDVLNRVRERYGLSPLVGNAGWAWLEADATVVLASRHYVGDFPADWPPMRGAGFSIWDGPPGPGQRLDDDLASFLDAGDPPVLVTLGTSAASGAGRTFAAISDGLAAHGLRSVLLVGDEANLRDLDGHPAARAFAPMTQLLPRCRAAVVSGALGGIAASLSAGVPAVVHPQLFDQLWNGGRVEALGVGAMARKPTQVVDAVVRIANDPAYAARANELARGIAEEDGAQALADAALALAGSPAT